MNLLMLLGLQIVLRQFQLIQLLLTGLLLQQRTHLLKPG